MFEACYSCGDPRGSVPLSGYSYLLRLSQDREAPMSLLGSLEVIKMNWRYELFCTAVVANKSVQISV